MRVFRRPGVRGGEAVAVDPAAVLSLARPLRDDADLDPLLDRVGDARYVLLGEATHGTSEFYTWRTRITRRLLQEKGFSFVAVEGDWPSCYRVSCSVLGDSDEHPRDALASLQRWPTWMWANEEAAELATWLRDWNAGRPRPERAGFYGLDVYSLWESLRAVLDYLAEHEPEHVEAARRAFACFEPYREDPQRYAWATLVPQSCEREVVDLLGRLHDAPDRTSPVPVGSRPPRDERFDAEQNAAAAAGAERFYRSMVRGSAESWNVRDTHMADTLDRLVQHLGEQAGRPAKAVVWAHNTHIGDARATDMADEGMHNLGQLVRERHGDDATVLVGFGTTRGRVIAADVWGGPTETMSVPPARVGSLEAMLDETVGDAALLVFPEHDRQPPWLRSALPHRAIGVVYHPRPERRGNYVPTVLGDRYDVFCFLPETGPVRPLTSDAGR